MVAGEGADVELVAHPQRVEEVAVGIDHGTGRVDESLVVEGALPAAVALLHHVVLQLRPGHRSEPELGVLVDDVGEHAARRGGMRGAVGLVDIGDDVRHSGLPWHVADHRRHDLRDEIGQAVGDRAVRVEHIAARGGHPHALAERRAVTECPLHLRDEHVLGAGDAQDVGVEDAQDVDTAGLEAGADIGEIERPVGIHG